MTVTAKIYQTRRRLTMANMLSLLCPFGMEESVDLVDARKREIFSISISSSEEEPSRS